eukprot:1922711-Rhodomonas_salina.2
MSELRGPSRSSPHPRHFHGIMISSLAPEVTASGGNMVGWLGRRKLPDDILRIAVWIHPEFRPPAGAAENRSFRRSIALSRACPLWRGRKEKLYKSGKCSEGDKERKGDGKTYYALT